MTPTAKPEQPSWWTTEHTAGWDAARPEVKKSWEKKAATDKAPDSSAWTESEPAVRFGHGARHHYDASGKVDWKEAEPKLEADWTKLKSDHPWTHARAAVMHGWNSHTRSGKHVGSAAGLGGSASGLGSSPAGDSGSGSGDA